MILQANCTSSPKIKYRIICYFLSIMKWTKFRLTLDPYGSEICRLSPGLDTSGAKYYGKNRYDHFFPVLL